MEVSDLATLLKSDQQEAKTYAEQLGGAAVQAEVKEYSDATYENYHSLGLSFCYSPSTSSSASNRILSYIDIYNPPPITGQNVRARRKEAWFGYSIPKLPITFTFLSTSIPIPALPSKALPNQTQSETSKREEEQQQPKEVERKKVFEVKEGTTGKDFVGAFGEPTKKGEGQPGYIPTFLEWDNVEIETQQDQGRTVGVLVELTENVGGNDGPNKGNGAGMWDRAGGWIWTSLKIFQVDTEA